MEERAENRVRFSPNAALPRPLRWQRGSTYFGAFLDERRTLFQLAPPFCRSNLQFLFGYATFAALDARSIAIGSFFGWCSPPVIARTKPATCEADLANGIGTKAVTFGKTQSFLAGLALFTAATGCWRRWRCLELCPRRLVGLLLSVPPIFMRHSEQCAPG